MYPSLPRHKGHHCILVCVITLAPCLRRMVGYHLVCSLFKILASKPFRSEFNLDSLGLQAYLPCDMRPF
jgi:hypothetical protein